MFRQVLIASEFSDIIKYFYLYFSYIFTIPSLTVLLKPARFSVTSSSHLHFNVYENLPNFFNHVILLKQNFFLMLFLIETYSNVRKGQNLSD